MKQSSVLTILIVLVGGCSSIVETRVASDGEQSPAIRPYMISTVAETSPELRDAYKLVAASMAKKGFAIVKEAPLHLEITLDARPAALSLGSKAGPADLSPAKQKKLLQSCEDREYRLGVTLTEVADGKEIYRSRVAEYHCKVTMTDALPTLVEAALTDLGRPGGSYVLTRKGRQ